MTKGRLLAGLVVLLMAVACGGAGSENGGQGPESLSPTTTTAERPASGAIAEAKALEAQELTSIDLDKEAAQFGLTLLSWEEEEYKRIRERLFANDELASALRAADDAGVWIHLKREFFVGTGYVGINVDAVDQEIIEFLITATPESKARKVAFDELVEEATRFGLRLQLSEEEEYKRIRERLFANDELASALKSADDNGVGVLLSRIFLVRVGYIAVNVDATDQEIIEFLVGK